MMSDAGIDSGLVIIVAVTVMFLAGSLFVRDSLVRKDQGLGANSLKALGIVCFIPLLVFAVGYADLSGEVISALLGTIAGFIFAGRADEARA
ncbi:MAG: hypothetical protein AAF813_01710 [Pseudomonadota bacterium]